MGVGVDKATWSDTDSTQGGDSRGGLDVVFQPSGSVSLGLSGVQWAFVLAVAGLVWLAVVEGRKT
jgi:hypothetical protein